VAFVQRHEPNRTSTIVASDKHEVFFAVEKVFEPGRSFGKVEIERSNTNGVHDFAQQLANHYSDFMRIVCGYSLDGYVRGHLRWPNGSAHPPRAREWLVFAE
jgi:hypothetical protein